MEIFILCSLGSSAGWCCRVLVHTAHLGMHSLQFTLCWHPFACWRMDPDGDFNFIMIYLHAFLLLLEGMLSLKWDLHISCSFSPAAFALFTIALSLWSFSSAVLPQLKMPSVSIPSTVCCSSNSPNGSLQKQHFSKGVCSLHKREHGFLNTADVSTVDCQIFSFSNTFLLADQKIYSFLHC